MYSPKTIMSGDTLNYKIPLYHKIDQYCQVQEEDTPRKARQIVLRQLVSKGPAMLLRQWIQPVIPQHYSVKIYLDEIDKLGNYESILTKWRLYIFPRDVIVTSNHL